MAEKILADAVTAASNGSANSARKRTYGRCGDAAGAARTSRHCCKGSTDGLKEDWKMAIDEEVDSKKKLDQRRKELRNQLRVQKRSHKLQSLKDRKKQCQKDAGNCAGKWRLSKTKMQKERLDFKSWDERSSIYFWQKRILMKRSETVVHLNRSSRGGAGLHAGSGMRGGRSKLLKKISRTDLRCCIKPQSPRFTHREEKTKMRRSKRNEQLAAKWVNQLQGPAIKGFRQP